MINDNLHNIGTDFEYVLRDKDSGRIIKHWTDNEIIKHENEITTEHFSEGGDLISAQTQPMRSFVGNFITYCIQDRPDNYVQSFMGTNANSSSGIQIGQGGTPTNAVAIGDTALQSLITHSASGMYYLAGSVALEADNTTNAGYITVKIQREFRNDSAATTYTVKECGIKDTAYLEARDVLSDISVGVGQRIRITYTFKLPTTTTKSWTKWYAQCFRSQAGNITNGFIDTSNTARTISQIFYAGNMNNSAGNLGAAAGVDTRGIVVGSGTNDCSWTDYNLQSKIAHGAGTLSYSACGDSAGGRYIAPATSGSSRIVEYWRDYTNNHATDSYTVSEIGAVVYNGTYNFLMLRWKPASAIVIAPGQVLTVKLKFKVTV